MSGDYERCATNLVDGRCGADAQFIVSQDGNGWEDEGGQPVCSEHVAQVLLCHSSRCPMTVTHVRTRSTLGTPTEVAAHES